MAKTPSNMVPLGSAAPQFVLPDVTTGEMMSLDAMKSRIATVVMFLCNHCPFVKHVQVELVNLAKEYKQKGVSFIAISSNDVANYPDDSPEKMKQVAKDFTYPFPYLYDETQQVAKDYQAACTPDFYIYDGQMKLVYRGQMDGSRPGNDIPVTAEDLRKTLDCLLNNKPVSEEQSPSIGCNIKWKQ